MNDLARLTIDMAISQGELLTTLSLASVGFGVSVILWELSRTSDSSARPILWRPSLIFFLVLMSLSIGAFYVAQGIIISNVPNIAFHQFPEMGVSSGEEDASVQFRQSLREAGYRAAENSFFVQLVLFVVALLCLIAFGWKNWFRE